MGGAVGHGADAGHLPGRGPDGGSGRRGAFVAEQLGSRIRRAAGVRGALADGVRASVGDPRQCGYREFAAGEAELREFLAARVWALEEGPRALFDRAVVWLIEHRVLLPGITVLARVVAEVRAAENERLHGRSPMRRRRAAARLERLLVVPKAPPVGAGAARGGQGELGQGYQQRWSVRSRSRRWAPARSSCRTCRRRRRRAGPLRAELEGADAAGAELAPAGGDAAGDGPAAGDRRGR